MDDNSLLVIILAFMLGCMCSGMMEQMCGRRLVEGKLCTGTGDSGENCDFWQSSNNCNNNWQFNWFSPHQQCGWDGTACKTTGSCEDNS